MIKNRIGYLPVKRDNSAKINFQNQIVKIEGPKGKLALTIPEQFNLKIDEEFIKVIPFKEKYLEKKELKALHGTLRQLLSNMIIGVTKGFKKILELKGVGYRAQIAGKKLTLHLGYSLPIEYLLKNEVTANVENNTKIILASCDKQILGQTAAEIRFYRPPEPYKGKGVHYENEQIIRKAGKTAKKAS